jgi:protein TonB
VAIALIAHALLIAGLEFAEPQRTPRPTEVLALRVITQPGLESPTPAVVAFGRSPPTLPHTSTEMTQTTAAAETTAPPPPVIPAAAPALLAMAADVDVESRPETTPEPEPEPERIRLSDAASLLEAEAIDDGPEQRSISAADIFASRTAEMASLATRTEGQRTTDDSHLRRKAISTATRDYLYANYLEAWQRKAERIGNLNYPREARELGLYGNLTLHVAVRSDGTLEGIRVVRSSGHEVLDQAAVRIVELAAPFAPFPPGIKRDTDVLDITVPWQFQRHHRLGWGR